MDVINLVFNPLSRISPLIPALDMCKIQYTMWSIFLHCSTNKIRNLSWYLPLSRRYANVEISSIHNQHPDSVPQIGVTVDPREIVYKVINFPTNHLPSSFDIRSTIDAQRALHIKSRDMRESREKLTCDFVFYSVVLSGSFLLERRIVLCVSRVEHPKL